MKTLRGEWMKLSLALLATSAGCALVGYDLSGYKSAGSSGAGGSASTGTPGDATGQSTGTGGSSAEAGSGGASSGEGSTGSGTGQHCFTAADCDDDGKACTTNACVNEFCEYVPEDTCCPHSVCSIGDPLNKDGCVFEDTTKAVECVADVCSAKPDCCLKEWTQECIDLAKTSCLPVGLPTASFSCDCDYCVEGPALNAFCDPCVHAVCQKPGYEFCCTPGMQWTQDCVVLTADLCHVPSTPACQ